MCLECILCNCPFICLFGVWLLSFIALLVLLSVVYGFFNNMKQRRLGRLLFTLLHILISCSFLHSHLSQSL